jgi:hypothetical protein
MDQLIPPDEGSVAPALSPLPERDLLTLKIRRHETRVKLLSRPVIWIISNPLLACLPRFRFLSGLLSEVGSEMLTRVEDSVYWSRFKPQAKVQAPSRGYLIHLKVLSQSMGRRGSGSLLRKTAMDFCPEVNPNLTPRGLPEHGMQSYSLACQQLHLQCWKSCSFWPVFSLTGCD